MGDHCFPGEAKLRSEFEPVRVVKDGRERTRLRLRE
jgi:hypothetical protein